MRLTTALVLATLNAGCGLDRVGVLAINFPLFPVPGSTDPRVAQAGGAVAIDVVADTGRLTATGLWAPDAGSAILASLRFAARERDRLPGYEDPLTSPTSTGGALVQAHVGVPIQMDGLEAVSLGALVIDRSGKGELRFSTALVGRALGACRAAEITISTVPAAEVILRGHATDSTQGSPSSPPSTTSGGHSHGV